MTSEQHVKDVTATTQPKVLALGELLIDFTPVHSEQAVPVFAANPGGAPANVCAALVKFGVPAGFIGKVGDDAFGRQLESTLQTVGVDTAGLVLSKSVPTTLAFVHLAADGERSFHFYRHPGADTQLNVEDVDLERVARTPAFHFGSVSLTDNPARSATFTAADIAKQAGRLVSFDVNLRPMLWSDLAAAKAEIQRGLEFAHVVKLSEEELAFLCPEVAEELPALVEYLARSRTKLVPGADTLAPVPIRWVKAIEALTEKHLVSVLLVTLGAHGSLVYAPEWRAEVVYVASLPVQAVDTTGAGDAFMAAVLSRLAQIDFRLDKLSSVDWPAVVRFANAAGALTATRHGAIPALPTVDEVAALLADCAGYKV
ncbi:carbohydrate kinase family protein [Alicyclobacillus herbarius]|uniref:carbohydrate kinase family protein n=1 Tax=Alicyclobacillus herbarius TaxID=122960 RepID=UPI0003FB33DE|nr:carbohydrate kinase [Alicyclobacillus herbarius]